MDRPMLELIIVVRICQRHHITPASPRIPAYQSPIVPLSLQNISRSMFNLASSLILPGAMPLEFHHHITALPLSPQLFVIP